MERPERKFEYYPWLLGLLVLISRVLTAGPLYWADGPAHMLAIQTRRFVIHPPGYWLFNQAGGLFSNPEKGISFMNWAFSAAGVVVFYYVARLLVSKRTAELGCILYAVVFYVWFSGDVHSTYASQLLFPILVFLFLILHLREPRTVYLLGAAAAFAIGAGFRPSDGAFLGPMFVYYLARYASGRQAAIAFLVAILLCLGWVVPTVLAYHTAGGAGYFTGYVANITTTVSPLRDRNTYRSMANIARFLAPLGTALWLLAYPVLKSLGRLRERPVRLLWLWIAPGACFLTLIYMADAPYLNFLTAAALLLAMIAIDMGGVRWGHLLLGCCLVWNAAFYLAFRPLPGNSLPVNVLNIYSGKYTWYGVKNQWQPNLSDVCNPAFLKGTTETQRHGETSPAPSP